MASGESGGVKRGFGARIDRWLDSDLVGWSRCSTA